MRKAGIDFMARLRASRMLVRSGAPVLAVLLVTLAAPAKAWGQVATGEVHACYVPGSGTIYRIRTAGTPDGCTGTGHVEFTLGNAMAVAAARGPGNGGGPDPVDHGSLGGLQDDDHPQYLLADGVRASLNGFAVVAAGLGSIPASGPGTRMMWYPGKAAFRAGRAGSDDWDDANVGLYSTAMGFNVAAAGRGAVALGEGSRALGDAAFAMGSFSQANGSNAAAIGNEAKAEASASYSIGSRVVATSPASMALGFGATANHFGSIVISDASTTQSVSSVADNQFVVRAQKIWLGANIAVTSVAGRYIETSTGAFLSTGGTWTNSSDVNRKEHFADVAGEDVLARLATMPILTWNYRDEDSTVRHMGPTAQAFRAAYGLGDSETAIATVDADGIALAAAQALERRTAEQAREITELRALVRELQLRLEQVAPGTPPR
jgi:hypothetical protein